MVSKCKNDTSQSAICAEYPYHHPFCRCGASTRNLEPLSTSSNDFLETHFPSSKSKIRKIFEHNTRAIFLRNSAVFCVISTFNLQFCIILYINITKLMKIWICVVLVQKSFPQAKISFASARAARTQNRPLTCNLKPIFASVHLTKLTFVGRPLHSLPLNSHFI